MEETANFGTALDTSYILGMAKSEGHVKALLDINRVVSTETLERIHSAAAT